MNTRGIPRDLLTRIISTCNCEITSHTSPHFKGLDDETTQSLVLVNKDELMDRLLRVMRTTEGLREKAAIFVAMRLVEDLANR